MKGKVEEISIKMTIRIVRRVNAQDLDLDPQIKILILHQLLHGNQIEQVEMIHVLPVINLRNITRPIHHQDHRGLGQKLVVDHRRNHHGEKLRLHLTVTNVKHQRMKIAILNQQQSNPFSGLLDHCWILLVSVVAVIDSDVS